MGVMACGRHQCSNILCDRLIEHRRYICESCFEELLKFKASWKLTTMVSEVRLLIEAFMDTSPGTFKVTPEEVNEEFNRLVC